MVKFRFQDLKIWQLAIEIADELFDLADQLEDRKLYRFAEQLRASGCPCPTILPRVPDRRQRRNSFSFLT